MLFRSEIFRLGRAVSRLSCAAAGVGQQSHRETDVVPKCGVWPSDDLDRVEEGGLNQTFDPWNEVRDEGEWADEAVPDAREKAVGSATASGMKCAAQPVRITVTASRTRERLNRRARRDGHQPRTTNASSARRGAGSTGGA